MKKMKKRSKEKTRKKKKKRRKIGRKETDRMTDGRTVFNTCVRGVCFNSHGSDLVYHNRRSCRVCVCLCVWNVKQKCEK